MPVLALLFFAALCPFHAFCEEATAAVPPLSPAVNPALLPVLSVQPHSPLSRPLKSKRLLAVIPDYQTVDPTDSGVPLSPSQKWNLAFKETADPFTLANAVLTASFSQCGNQTPKYGEGGVAFAKRFGAAVGDVGTQNVFSAGVLANLLHQDPRYFRMGPREPILKRAVYSVTRTAVTRQDSGRAAFNATGLGAIVLGILASNAYYPSASVHGYVMAERLTTSLTGGVVGNLMSEFLPDVQKELLPKLFHKRGQSQAGKLP